MLISINTSKIPSWQHAGGEEDVADRLVVLGVAGGVLVDVAEDPLALVFAEPFGLGGSVREKKVEGDAEKDGGHAFDEKEPLPAAKAELAVEVEERAGDESHEGGAEGQGDVEAADGAGAQLGREPLHEVEDDSGEEAGLGHAEEEAHGVELRWSADEEHADGEQAPGDHDAGEPAACAEAIEQEVGGNLAGGVAEEEEAGAEAVGGGAEVQIAIHLERGEADVDAIHVGGAVSEGDEGDEAQRGFAHGGCADGCVG